MTVPTRSWEQRLSALAHEPLRCKLTQGSICADRESLRQAYRHCTALTREHSKTFYLASGLLPPRKRRAIRALYAFCRKSDDLVDRTEGDALGYLEAWRERALGPHPPASDPVALAWTHTRLSYGIPVHYGHQLLDGVAKDVEAKRYATIDELAEYAYGVASTVGLMAMHVIGFRGPEAIPYAIKLGVALQLTNILRDVAEDWERGLLYLPQEEMEAFNLGEADVAARRVDERWRAFLQFQIERTRRLYAEAMPGIRFLHPDGRLAVAAAARLYEAILEDIEAHGGDVFNRRAYVSSWGKLRRLPGIWLALRRHTPARYGPAR